jgi:predicted DsbA family dithiol-disulfide isomerase
VLGEERQAEKWRNEGLVEDFKNAESQEEMAEAIERMGAKEGYEIDISTVIGENEIRYKYTDSGYQKK